VFPSPFRVVLDANVLYPFTLRDTLLRAAAAGFFQAFWSSQILDEVTRNLVANGVMDVSRAERLRAVMERAFPEAMVTGHEALAGAMNTADEDRHVAAAAVKAGAQVIVTRNLKHFTNLPEGVEAQSPDLFLSNALDLDPAGMIALLRDQAGALKRPPRTFEELLLGLEKQVPDFVAEVRRQQR
jgi:predicted nucleic acid-binding protein